MIGALYDLNYSRVQEIKEKALLEEFEKIVKQIMNGG
jgi:hypothetical protein